MLNKEKNFILVTTDNNKTYKFDINTGIIYGVRGTPVKTYPPHFKTTVRNEVARSETSTWLTTMLRLALGDYGDRMLKDRNLRSDWGGLLACPYLTQVSDLFTLADRLDSIHYPVERHYSYFNVYSEEYENLRIVNKYFKQFAKQFRDNPDDCSIKQFADEFRRVMWEQDNEKALRNIDDNLKEWFYRYKEYIPDSKLDYYVYFITHGLSDFLGIQFCNRSHYSNSREGFRNAINIITDVFNKAEEMNYPITKDNFFTQAININKMYTVFKEKIDKEKLQQVYSKRKEALQFETDDFVVVIPMTERDFMEEASQQNNCVYTHYLPKVLKDETYVVFIRKKNRLNKSYVTCEVNQRGYIQQYLTTNNDSIRDDFRAQYAEHLRKNW